MPTHWPSQPSIESTTRNEPLHGDTEMKSFNSFWVLLACYPLLMPPQSLSAQQATLEEQSSDQPDTGKQVEEKQERPVADQQKQPSAEEQRDREMRLAKYLTGAKFLGNFTIEGKSDALPKPEAYTISKCEKLPQPDMYRLTARIKYGEIDSEVPLDLKILWAGRTPVITMDAFWIPGMGTFGARVLIHAGRYAGTWQHDEVGGHLFGVIKKE